MPQNQEVAGRIRKVDEGCWEWWVVLWDAANEMWLTPAHRELGGYAGTERAARDLTEAGVLSHRRWINEIRGRVPFPREPIPDGPAAVLVVA